MANKKKEVTKAPSGLTITRSENKFTASWKIGDKDYEDGQYLQYSINDTGKDSWQPTADSKKKIGVKTTSKAISIDKDNFYPNKDEKGNNKPLLYEIGFRVKGNRKKYTTGSGKKKKTHSPVSSEWTEERFTVNPPKEPTLTVELDEELTNVCKFSWSAPYESDDSYIFTDTQWQTILVKNNSETDGSKLSWKGETFDEGTAGAESSKTITEDTAILYRDGNSYTRWFRVRARGPRGVSQDGSYGWVYEKHVYALPNKTNVTGTSAKETDEGGFQCIVDWTVGQSNGQKPIDKVTVQYTIVVPDENLSCPNGASWTDANISRDTADGDAAVFSIDDQLGKDQCLFIRVNTQHDRNITYGKPKLSSVGFLKDPTGLSVQTNNVTHKATINATNVSGVEDSVLVVRYVPAEGDPIDVGVIPHGSSSVTVQCPNWDEQSAIGFEVYAMVGEAIKQTREDGVDSYAVTPKMRSQNTVSQGGAVPVAPQNVNVSRVEGKPDTVQVTWDWPWSEAGSAEISWSDHDDAWESTDEPESFLISNLHASKWNISGLETGKTWYIRVRLIAGNVSDSETVTYGPWSDISQGSINLSSAPNKPVLILSDSIIPEDGSTTASWVYTTTDNTAQAYAEVAVVENGEYIPIAHSLTSQHVTIPANSENYTLTTGNTYNLVCRVQSASGKISEWSDVVSLSIAEPLECDIPVSSLEFETSETNPREFTGNPIEFDTELNENIRKLEIALEPTQLGEGTPSPSNVRPIYGVGGVTVDVVGKNLFDKTATDTNNGYYSGRYIRAVDGATVNLATASVSEYIEIDGGVEYTVSPVSGSNPSVCFYDSAKIFLSGDAYGGATAKMFTTPSNAKYIRFTITNADVDTTQLEIGTETTTYEPYTEQTITATLPQTVYGGTLDLVSGVLTVTHTAVDMGSLIWSSYGTGLFYANLTGAKVGDYSTPANAYCSCYEILSKAQTATETGVAINNGQSRANAHDSSYATASDFKTAVTGQTLCYELATPTTYQLTPHELETLIGKNTVSTENGNMSIRIAESYEEGYFLTKMPLEATVTGIEEGGKISVVVERAEDYKLDRPDEDEFNGYEGETILQKTNSNPVKFETEDMTGSLDDGAKYNLIATIQDGLGQKAEKVLPFTVKWEHQALEPSAEIVIDEEQLIAKIRPIAPQGADPTDVADIYRLSADKPELIYSGATFGEWYVDPYPALGDMGGHRIVLRTKNGDYITADNQIAMIDSPELGVNPIENEEELNIIDFNGRQIQFYFDTDYSNTWAKDFQETQYLGGSIQGDWNPAVSRSGTLSSQAITVLDQDMLKNVRRLAEHSGICHVRTADGSSYAADVQVSEDRVHDDREMLVNYSLSITRVDSQGFDGMTLESWESEYPDEEEEPEEE